MRKLLVYRLVWLVPYPQKSLRRVFQLGRRAGVYPPQIVYKSVPENAYKNILIQIGERAFQIAVPDVLYPAFRIIQVFLSQRRFYDGPQIITKETQDNYCYENNDNPFNHETSIANRNPHDPEGYTQTKSRLSAGFENYPTDCIAFFSLGSRGNM